MIEIRNLALPLSAGLPSAEEVLRRAAATRLGVEEARIASVRLLRRSVDARRKSNVHFVATLGVTLAAAPSAKPGATPPAAEEDEAAIVRRLADAEVSLATPAEAPAVVRLEHAPAVRPVVVGTGPAGLFAALALARAGARPIVLERGRPVDERIRSIETFVRERLLDPESNIQFGEGGAGTFSDGKLTTGTRDQRGRLVLETFVEAGAPEEILWQAKPHIGTDSLTPAVKRIRETVESLGGEVRFGTRLSGLVLGKDRALEAVIVKSERGREEFAAEAVILATGHSARDTFKMLHAIGAALRRKPFSIGVRIEHLQSAVDRAQYGSAAGHPAPGAADYKLACHLPSGRSVYTFCMCPGGEVVAAASETGRVVTNGMSRFARDGTNANAGFLVNVTPEDFGSYQPLAGIAFQRRWERAAFRAGGSDYRAPVQLLGDFMQGVASSGPGGVLPTYPLGVTYTDLVECLPEFVVASLRAAVPEFERRLRGFGSPDAVLTGVETRSSSPVRVLRDESLQSNLRGLYPCGEGAGYAGGIVSAAVDGLRCAEAVLERYR